MITVCTCGGVITQHLPNRACGSTSQHQLNSHHLSHDEAGNHSDTVPLVCLPVSPFSTCSLSLSSSRDTVKGLGPAPTAAAAILTSDKICRRRQPQDLDIAGQLLNGSSPEQRKRHLPRQPNKTVFALLTGWRTPICPHRCLHFFIPMHPGGQGGGDWGATRGWMWCGHCPRQNTCRNTTLGNSHTLTAAQRQCFWRL